MSEPKHRTAVVTFQLAITGKPSDEDLIRFIEWQMPPETTHRPMDIYCGQGQYAQVAIVGRKITLPSVPAEGEV